MTAHRVKIAATEKPGVAAPAGDVKAGACGLIETLHFF